jgi:hypothetical protein
MPDNGTNVRGAVAWILAIAASTFAALAWILDLHASQPHTGAATERETMDIRAEIRRLDEKIDTVRRELQYCTRSDKKQSGY